MKTITTLQIREDGMGAALFFFLWYIARNFFHSAENAAGIFMESYYIHLPFSCIIQYGKHSRQQLAILSICKKSNEHNINN